MASHGRDETPVSFGSRGRVLLGWVLLLAGAAALFLGWYGVSGTAVTAKQVPYVVSGGLVGVALVVLAASVFATDDVRRRLQRVDELESRVAELCALLLETPTDEAPAVVLAVPGGSTYHRPECRLVVGKESAEPVIEPGRLRPCRLCDPVLQTAF
jgi:hypothetical protein